MNLLRVSILRSETTTIVRNIGPWELPIIESANDGVEVLEEVPAGDRYELPDASLEFDRLVTKYKNDENGVPYVIGVYGTGSRGRAALAKEIDKYRAVGAAPPADLLADLGMEGVQEIAG